MNDSYVKKRYYYIDKMIDWDGTNRTASRMEILLSIIYYLPAFYGAVIWLLENFFSLGMPLLLH
jgi:hypothetical protein